MKKLLLALLLLALCVSAASATILPATGVDEAFRAWTGIDAIPAVVLCQSLSVYDERGDQGGRKVSTLYYSMDGATIRVIESWDGWAKIHYSDGAEFGWVRSDYLLMDPTWYRCDDAVQVYAYPDTMAPCVALLGTGDELPIITEYDTEYESWVCVSLRGAAGWIRKTSQDTVDDTWFRPEMLADITGAVLQLGDDVVGTTDKALLTELARLLTNVEDQGGPIAGCPFGAQLTLMLADGERIELQMATDSCCVYRVDSWDYQYARHYVTGDDSSPDNSVLFGIFGLDASSLWAR